MITYSRDVPVGTLRTVRGARARGTEGGVAALPLGNERFWAWRRTM